MKACLIVSAIGAGTIVCGTCAAAVVIVCSIVAAMPVNRLRMTIIILYAVIVCSMYVAGVATMCSNIVVSVAVIIMIACLNMTVAMKLCRYHADRSCSYHQKKYLFHDVKF